MTASHYLPVSSFAALVEISERKARQALQRCWQGGTWRGIRLHVRRVPASGGPGGMAYQVLFESIPAHLLRTPETPLNVVSAPAQDPPSALSAIVAQPSTTAGPLPSLPAPCPPKQMATLMLRRGERWRADVIDDPALGAWRQAILRPVLHTKPNTSERATAIAEAAQGVTHDHKGKPLPNGISGRTVRSWLRDLMERGDEALFRKRPSNAGKPRTHVSREWDRFMRDHGVAESFLAEAGQKMTDEVRRLWAGGAASWVAVQRFAEPIVFELIGSAKIECPVKDRKKLCRLSRRRIEELKLAGQVHKHDHDAGRWYDTGPSIARHRDDLMPMALVGLDVHHLDIYVIREDGTLCTPKIVAWYDIATNRVFASVFILPKGEAIRGEHILKSFSDLCADPSFGIPQAIYTDHGSEFNWLEAATPLMLLRKFAIAPGGAAALEGVLRAIPYNPRGKTIEGFFAAFKKTVVAHYRGYIDGDRMKKKTHMQGAEPRAYPGTPAEVEATIKNIAIPYYHTGEQIGSLKGKSPNERFDEFVNAGWEPTLLDPTAVGFVLAKPEGRVVQAGGKIALDGQIWQAKELLIFADSSERHVIVRRPMLGDRDKVAIFTAGDEFLCIAEPQPVFSYGDKAGAAHSNAMKRERERQVKELRPQAPAINLEERMAQVVAYHGPQPVPQTFNVATIDPRIAEAAQAAESRPTPRQDADRRLLEQQEQAALRKQMLENTRRQQAEAIRLMTGT